MIDAILSRYRKAFAGLPRDLWLLAIITLIHRSGTMVVPFLGLYAIRSLGLTTQQAGILLTLYGVGAMLGAWIGGRLSDRLGSLRTMFVFFLLASVALVAITWVSSFGWLCVSIVFAATTAEGYRPANATAMAELSTPDNRFRAYALRRLAVNLGVAIGPSVGGFLASNNYHWLFYCDGATCFVAALVMWKLFHRHPVMMPRPRPTLPDRVLVPVASPWRDLPFLKLMLLVTCLSVVFLQLMGTFPLDLVQSFGFEERVIGLLMAINTLVIAAFEMVLIDAVSRFPVLQVIRFGALAICFGFGMLPLGSGMAFIIASCLVWTVGEMLSFPLIEGVAANYAPEAARGRYLGLYTACFSISFMLAPLLGTYLYVDFGPSTLWGSCALVGVILFFAIPKLEPWFGEASNT